MPVCIFTPSICMAVEAKGREWQAHGLRGSAKGGFNLFVKRWCALRSGIVMPSSPVVAPLIATARCKQHVILFVSCSFLLSNFSFDKQFWDGDGFGRPHGGCGGGRGASAEPQGWVVQRERSRVRERLCRPLYLPARSCQVTPHSGQMPLLPCRAQCRPLCRDGSD